MEDINILEKVDDAKFTVMQSTSKGNCIVASKPIEKGEIIVENEIPFVWNAVSIPGHRFHQYCDECGKVSLSHLLHAMQTTVPSSADTMKAINNLSNVESDSDLVCKLGCDKSYCSAECQSLSVAHGHGWLCESFQMQSNSWQQLREIDVKGHYGLAAKVYARIAAQCLLHKQRDPSIDISEDAGAVADALLSEYQSVDFTRTMHAYRTGMLEIDPAMFESFIFPAYFSSQLATPLQLTKDMFMQSGAVLWGEGAAQSSAAFLSSEIFSEKRYSAIVGTFVINCLSVHVASPLDSLWAQVNQCRLTADSTEEAAKMADVESVLQQFHDLQQVPSEEEEEAPKPPTGRFLGMSGSGLFPIFSKTNHSCVCNTSMHGGDRVSVSIVATEDIPQHAEITNCYIHHDSLNGGKDCFHIDAAIDQEQVSLGHSDQHQLNAKLTKKQRYRALRQYLFECDCPLCASQEVDSDEESDC